MPIALITDPGVCVCEQQEAHYSYQRFLEDHSSTSPPSSLSTSLRTSGVLY